MGSSHRHEVNQGKKQNRFTYILTGSEFPGISEARSPRIEVYRDLTPGFLDRAPFSVASVHWPEVSFARVV